MNNTSRFYFFIIIIAILLIILYFSKQLVTVRENMETCNHSETLGYLEDSPNYTNMPLPSQPRNPACNNIAACYGPNALCINQRCSPCGLENECTSDDQCGSNNCIKHKPRSSTDVRGCCDSM